MPIMLLDFDKSTVRSSFMVCTSDCFFVSTWCQEIWFRVGGEIYTFLEGAKVPVIKYWSTLWRAHQVALFFFTWCQDICFRVGGKIHLFLEGAKLPASKILVNSFQSNGPIGLKLTNG